MSESNPNSCGGITFPSGTCTPSLVESAARAAPENSNVSDHTGILESIEFQSVCGENAPCEMSLACAQKILEYCLNPMHVNISNGSYSAMDADARSMRNYPIFESEFCKSALQKMLWTGVVANHGVNDPASASEPHQTTSNGSHEALSAFCAVHGPGREPVTSGVAYSRFLEPANLVADMSKGDWSSTPPTQPPSTKWKLRGVPFGFSVNPQDNGETRDVMIVSLDVPVLTTPQIVTTVVDGVVAPYTDRARIGFFVTDMGGYQKMAPNGLSYMEIFKDVESYNATNYGAGQAPESSQIVVRASEPRKVKVDLSGDSQISGATVASVVPEFHATVDKCTTHESGLVILDLINVYANTAQLYATDDANCGCFTPFTIGQGSGGGQNVFFVQPNPILDTHNVSPNGDVCRYSWNNIPSPTNTPDVYAAAKIGNYEIRMFKNLNGTNTSLPIHSDTPFNLRVPNSASADVFTINGALELSTPSPKDFLQELCACHLPQSIYDSYFTYLSKSGVGGAKDPTLFPGCASSRYPNAARAAQKAATGNDTSGKGLPCTPSLNFWPETQTFTSPHTSCLMNSFVAPNEPIGDVTVLTPNPTTDVATVTALVGVGFMTVLALAAILIAVIMKGRAMNRPQAVIGLPYPARAGALDV